MLTYMLYHNFLCIKIVKFLENRYISFGQPSLSKSLENVFYEFRATKSVGMNFWIIEKIYFERFILPSLSMHFGNCKTDFQDFQAANWSKMHLKQSKMQFKSFAQPNLPNRFLQSLKKYFFFSFMRPSLLICVSIIANLSFKSFQCSQVYRIQLYW